MLRQHKSALLQEMPLLLLLLLLPSSQEQVHPGGTLLPQHPNRIKEEGPVVWRDDADGIQIRRANLLHHLQLVVAVVNEVGRVLPQLQEGQPL